MKRFGPLKSLRGRVALVATGAVAVVLILVGVGALASFADRERERVDQSLTGRPAPDLVRALGGPPDRGPQGPPGGPEGGFGPPAFRPTGEYVRLISGGEVVAEVDAPQGLEAPSEPGLRTLSLDGTNYRSLTRPAGPGTLVENGVDLTEAEDRIAELRDRLLLIGAAGVLLVMLFSWWLAGLALRPLRNLREAVGRVSGTEDLSTRLDPGDSPSEIEQLTASVNAMLARLEESADETRQALDATRRFAGDAGHDLRTPMTALQANIGAVRRNPDIDSAERAAALEQMERDAARMMRMLGTLQTLARGDSAAVLPRERVEFSSLVGSAIESARRRHPEVDWKLELPESEIETKGWPDGLRALVDNLLENAARHGRTGGKVTATVSDREIMVVLTVDDDGPGIPPDQRDRMFERFERGDTTGSQGSGLGLSLVRQQASLHGGEVTVTDSPSGGARFEVTLCPEI